MGTVHAGTIPANALRVYLLGHGDPTPIAFHVEPIIEPEALREADDFMPDRVLVVPDSWTPGERYLFLAWPSENPAVAVRVASERAVDAASDSSTRADLRSDEPVTGELSAMTRGGSCSAQFGATSVHVRMTLPSRLDYMGGAFLYYTRVDGGRSWHPSRSLCQPAAIGRSWVGLGEETLYSRCSIAARQQDRRWSGASPDEPGLASGKHVVEMIAWLPGTKVEFRARAEIELECP